MKKLHIFTLVGRSSDVPLWRRASAVSLLWPRNIAALNTVSVLWDIYATPESRAEVEKVAEALPVDDVSKMEITMVQPVKDDSALRIALEKAQRVNAYFMPSPPDMIWGDGSIGALLRLMPFAYGRCLAVPHVRVATRKFMERFTGKPLTNAQLVYKAFAALHEAFAGSEVPSDHTNTGTTGTVWTRLSEHTYAAGFFIPTIHMMQPTPEDLKWFKATNGPDHWDHRWPAALVGTDRQRIVGSSDAAFMCELTEDDALHPPRGPCIKGKWDQYNGTMAHHIANRGTVAVFRGEVC